MKPVEQMSSMVTVDFMLGLPGGAWASPLPDGGEGTSSPPSPCPEGANQGLAPAQGWLLVDLDSFPDSKKPPLGVLIREQRSQFELKGHAMKIKEGLFTSPTIYRASWVYRLSPLLVCAGVVAFLWVITLCQATSSTAKGAASLSFFLLMISLFVLALGALLCLVTVNTFILTAPEGLLYSSSGTCVYTPWRNIAEVESKLMGSFKVENLRLRREAVSGLSLEEGIQQRIAVVTKTTAVRATEEALPVFRGVVLILSIVSILGGGRSHAGVSTSSNPPLQQYIPVGLFGSQWKYGQLGSDVYRHRNMDAHQGK